VTDSPDLGPPPVAHFEDGDPIKFDSIHEKTRSEGSSATNQESQPTLSAKFETRKKRRESSHHIDAGDRKLDINPSQEAIQKDPGAPTSQHLKSGAKRKLHAREEEEQPRRSEDQERDAFQFNRRTSELRSSEISTTKPKSSRTSKPVNERLSQSTTANTHSRKEKSNEGLAILTTTNRKVLGPSELPHINAIMVTL